MHTLFMLGCLCFCVFLDTMEAKMLSHSQTLSSLFHPQNFSTKLHNQCLKRPQTPSSPTKNNHMKIRAFFHEPIITSISQDILLQQDFLNSNSPVYQVAADTQGGYSLASYYTSLGLFVISVPGLWSLIKRSVKSKIVKKTFIDADNKPPNQAAGEILSFFTRNNFVVTDRGETVTFEGMMVPSRGQAALLTFCTCISLASVALVLTITVPDVGNNWFFLTALSPLAGAYYWKRASRKEQIQVKMILAEDGKLSEIVVQGDDQQIDEMRKELKFNEKGMVYVKGIFER